MEIGSSIPVSENQLQAVAAAGAQPGMFSLGASTNPVVFRGALRQYHKLTRFRHSIYPACPP